MNESILATIWPLVEIIRPIVSSLLSGLKRWGCLCSVRAAVRAQGPAQHHRVRREHNARRGGWYVIHVLAAAADHVPQHHHAPPRDRRQPLRAVRLARRVSQDRRLHRPALHLYDIQPVSYTHLTLPTNREV